MKGKSAGKIIAKDKPEGFELRELIALAEKIQKEASTGDDSSKEIIESAEDIWNKSGSYVCQ